MFKNINDLKKYFFFKISNSLIFRKIKSKKKYLTTNCFIFVIVSNVFFKFSNL